MDLTPAALRETTFRGALRGYNVQDVDDFVERVAVGVGELLEQLRLASERSAAAERRAKKIATSEDAMKRTLGHAQKLAESVLAEARQEASRLTEEARQAALRVRAAAADEVTGERLSAQEARAEAERLQRAAEVERSVARAEVEALRAAARAEAEAERSVAKAQVEALLARAAEGVDAEVQIEVGRLHGVRQALQLDVAVLTGWMHDQRDSVRAVLVETLAAIDRSSHVEDPPPVTEVDATVRVGAGWLPAEAPAAAPSPPPVPEPGPEASPPELAQEGLPPTEEPAAPGGDLRSEGAEPAVSGFPELSDEEFLAELKKAATDTD